MAQPCSIERAIELLKSGEVVALPTETVYGLAGLIDREETLKKIFNIKKRPFFDPLIVHVASIEMAKSLVEEWPEAARVLCEEFWPGPLTLVLPKNENVNPLVTSGLETVALRMPQHPLALEVLQKLGKPLAAPSANRFGKTSPTSAEHVMSEFSDDVAVVDGGESQVGIESTIIELNESTIKLLRPGVISFKKIQEFLKLKGFTFAYQEILQGEQAPGQVKHHYMPEQAVVIASQENGDLVNQVNRELKTKYTSYQILNLGEDVNLAARQLYSELRRLAGDPSVFILFIRKPQHQSEEWSAIMNRLNRAASLQY